MNWDKIAGQNHLKNQLKQSILENRVSHAQLFLGKEGYGTLPLALAYANEILSQENESSSEKINHLNHLDLHFSFPVFTEKKENTSSRFYTVFREMILENPYANLDDWSSVLESENKQLFISANEIDELNQKFSLKSFEGGTKILIVWRADKMNNTASNKLLKFLEEPPQKTVIILTAENTNDFLPTIISRTQIIEIQRIDDDEIRKNLEANTTLSASFINEIVHQAQGDLNTAYKLAANESNNEFEDFFVQWVRDAFQVKKHPEFLKNIILWSRQIASWNREKQKQFLEYCAEMFRLALLENYGNQDLVYKRIVGNSFKWHIFSRYVHGANIAEILNEISETDYHLQRNGNAKIIWTDLGIKLSRYIHKSK